MAYKAPIWEDGKSPAISAENLNALSQAAEGAQVLYGNSAPTSSTEGAVGQFYLVVVADSDGNYPLYQCVAIANGSYVWRDTRRIPDSVTSMLGIPAPGTINSALNVLANIGNVHVWSRTVKIADDIPATYCLGSAAQLSIGVPPAGTGINRSVTYSDSVSVADDGTVTLSGTPTTATLYFSMGQPAPSEILGKYFLLDSVVYFCPTDATCISNGQATPSVMLVSPQRVIGVPMIPAGTNTDFVTSIDSTAYPQDGDVGDYHYTYLGQLGEPGAKIEVGSYVGTGTYGSSNPCSISAPGEIIAILFLGRNEGDVYYTQAATPSSSHKIYNMVADTLTTSYGVRRGFFAPQSNGTSVSAYGKKSADGKTFSWYNTENYRAQFNVSTAIYYFLVIYK